MSEQEQIEIFCESEGVAGRRIALSREGPNTPWFLVEGIWWSWGANERQRCLLEEATGVFDDAIIEKLEKYYASVKPEGRIVPAAHSS